MESHIIRPNIVRLKIARMERRFSWALCCAMMCLEQPEVTVIEEPIRKLYGKDIGSCIGSHAIQCANLRQYKLEQGADSTRMLRRPKLSIYSVIYLPDPGYPGIFSHWTKQATIRPL